MAVVEQNNTIQYNTIQYKTYNAPLIRYTILALYKFICMYVCMYVYVTKMLFVGLQTAGQFVYH